MKRIMFILGVSIIMALLTVTAALAGTFIKYYKISQLIHTQSIAN